MWRFLRRFDFILYIRQSKQTKSMDFHVKPVPTLLRHRHRHRRRHDQLTMTRFIAFHICCCCRRRRRNCRHCSAELVVIVIVFSLCGAQLRARQRCFFDFSIFSISNKTTSTLLIVRWLRHLTSRDVRRSRGRHRRSACSIKHKKRINKSHKKQNSINVSDHRDRPSRSSAAAAVCCDIADRRLYRAPAQATFDCNKQQKGNQKPSNKKTIVSRNGERNDKS
jgi:hypothetical protein